MVSSLRTLRLALGFKDFSPVSSKSSVVLHFTFKSMMRFELIFVYGIGFRLRFFFFFASGYPIVPALFIKKIILPPLIRTFIFTYPPCT